jgi:hypothetical protein
VSARHQVKRLDRISEAYALSKEGFALSKTGPAEETGFLRSVRVPLPRNFTGPKAQVKSDPDVFADALVPRNAFVPIAAPLAPGALIPRSLSGHLQAQTISGQPRDRSQRPSYAARMRVLRTLQLPASITTASECRIVRRSPLSVRRTRDPVAGDDCCNIAAMVIVPRSGRVNRTSRLDTEPCGAGTSAISRLAGPLARLHPVHRDT